MQRLKDSITDTIQKIDRIAALFYQQKGQEGYADLEQIIISLNQTVNDILSYQADKEDKIIDEALVNTVLIEAAKAMEQKDIVLLADILTFEVNGLLEDSLSRI